MEVDQQTREDFGMQGGFSVHPGALLPNDGIIQIRLQCDTVCMVEKFPVSCTQQVTPRGP